MPESRWVGDTLVYFVRDEIRRWSAGTVTTVARLPAELTPRYPQDDVHFSGDGQRFTLTRYSRSGGAVRYLGTTATGRVERLDPPGVTHTEWGPTGHTLLVRYPDRLELRDDGGVRAAPLSRLGGPAHVWAADGTALLVGAVPPALPGGESLDTLAVWGGVQAAETARLPNLVGARAFSPSGEHFVGVSRTGLQTTRLEVYRCGGTATPAAPLTDAWRTAIASETRRLLRPATGTIVQGVFGNHTGVDLSTPLGSLIVAADDGVVGAIGWVPTGGERLCLQHAALMETCYFHIASSLVTTGQRVVRGQPIALIGLTGDTTGPHVHWEARIAGRVVDPLTR